MSISVDTISTHTVNTDTISAPDIGPKPPQTEWILRDGNWRDDGLWVDQEIWKDS